jgi:hypothetical protein
MLPNFTKLCILHARVLAMMGVLVSISCQCFRSQDYLAHELPYEDLLRIPVQDFATLFGLNFLTAGPNEPFALKIKRLEDYVRAQSGGRSLPVFMNQAAAMHVVPGSDRRSTGIELRDIDVKVALDLLCGFAGFQCRYTDYGLLIEKQCPEASPGSSPYNQQLSDEKTDESQ